MPQFEVAFYLSQAFWMLISFGVLFLLMYYVIFPMIQGVYAERDRIIQTNLTSADKTNQAAEKLMKNYHDYLLSAEQEASSFVQRAYREANESAHKTEVEHDRVLKQKLKKAESDLKKESDAALAQTDALSEKLAGLLADKLDGKTGKGA